MDQAFTHNKFIIKKHFWAIFGGSFHVLDQKENLLFYSKQKAFRLKEDFRIYSDESMSRELLKITTPQILDIGATYNVVDSTDGSSVGALRRKGLKSMLRDEWVLLNKENEEIAELREENLAGALLSRLINLVPQSYVISAQEKVIATIKQHFNPFLLKYSVEIQPDDLPVDRRLLAAAAILLCAIEGRQG